MPFVKNIKGKKEAFQRDEAQENNQTGCRNTDNSLKTNSDMNRGYDPHPRYQPRNLRNAYNPYNKDRRRPYHRR